MKVYQVQSQQSSYALKQNFARMEISPKAAASIKDAVKNGLLEQKVDLKSKRVNRALGKLGGVLEHIEFSKVNDYSQQWSWHIIPCVRYATCDSSLRAYGLAPTTFEHQPRVKEFISVLEKAYNDAKGTHQRWH